MRAVRMVSVVATASMFALGCEVVAPLRKLPEHDSGSNVATVDSARDATDRPDLGAEHPREQPDAGVDGPTDADAGGTGDAVLEGGTGDVADDARDGGDVADDARDGGDVPEDVPDGGDADDVSGGSMGDGGDTAGPGPSPDGGGGGSVVTKCDPWTRFRPPSAVLGLNRTPGQEFRLALSPDELTVYVAAGPDWSLADIYAAKRNSDRDPFGELAPLSSINSDQTEDSVSVTADGLRIFLDSNRSGRDRLYTAVRTTTGEPFGAPTRIMLGQDALDQYDPYVLPDGSALYFAANLPEFGGIFRTPLSDGQPGAPVLLFRGPRFPVVTQDELTLYFDDGSGDIWMATRASRDLPFGEPIDLAELNGNSSYDYPQWISPDGCRLYFGRVAGGGTFSMVAERVQ